jgi:hypothetical protein
MEGCGNKRFKQLAVIEFLTAEEKKNPIDIQRRKQAVYGVKCVDVSTVRRWVRQFKQEGCCTTVASRENTRRHFYGRDSKPCIFLLHTVRKPALGLTNNPENGKSF